ncbi:integrase [Pseudomonas sp. Pc102]|uniref:tyrosine-type recombinase/integrase n=1 Tax=Pseudomonas sp. Pc102 TaxID=2678261 RepID=UPI001BCCD98D|nr:integrase arm-type DNA-binding domain-containing protein [Pseudomonas sp. Pc102]BBP82467.1 integrase [Pseudomonas sp. Pc102]
MALTDTAARQAKPKEKAYTLADSLGLTLYVAPSGVKSWHFRFTWLNKQARISLGVYPDVGLKEARQRRDEAREEVASGRDPRESRRAAKASVAEAQERTFKRVYEEWTAFRQADGARNKKGKLSPGTLKGIRIAMDNDVLPSLGRLNIRAITRADVISIIRRIERRGAITSSVKTRQWMGQIFRYAIATGDLDADPTAEMHEVTEKAGTYNHRPFVDASSLCDVMNAIRVAPLSMSARGALMLMIYTACRPGEARLAQWEDVDLEAATWTIPADRMKMRRDHVMPLPAQAIELIKGMMPLSAGGQFVFPGAWSSQKPIGVNYATDAMASAGLRGKQSPHGFRHMFSTEMNGRGFNRDWIERQLAHADPSVIRDTYNHATYLEQRRAMMQEWADLVDQGSH